MGDIRIACHEEREELEGREEREESERGTIVGLFVR